jgi:hypothetical protein
MNPRRQSTAEATAPEHLQEAAELFLARQSGESEPEGSWIDRVWLPSDRERRPCCDGLEPDGLKDPQKLKSHCRTLLHVASLFDLDSRLLRAELRGRRKAREATREEQAAAAVAAIGADRRHARPARAVQREAAPSAEAAVLHAKLVTLIAEKRVDLKELAARTGRLCDELRRQLADEEREVEVVLAETGAADVVADLKALIDDIHHLAITRDTIRRVR